MPAPRNFFFWGQRKAPKMYQDDPRNVPKAPPKMYQNTPLFNHPSCAKKNPGVFWCNLGFFG